MYALFLLIFIIYIYILCDQNISFKNKSLILIYTFSMSTITFFGLKMLENETFYFWRKLENYNFYLFLLVVAFLEEMCKFFLIPFLSKDILIIDKLSIITAFGFSILESISYYYATGNVFLLMFRLICITPIHLFLGFFYYYLFYKVHIYKLNSKFYYIIPIFTTLCHFGINSFLSNTIRLYVAVFSAICLILMFVIAKEYMFNNRKKQV